MAEAVVIDAVRTPIGARGGALSAVHPVDLLGDLIGALIERTGVEPVFIDEVLVGCAVPVGAQAHNIARRAADAAGRDLSAPAVTLPDSHVALRAGVHAIQTGASAAVLVGGVDLASLVSPHAVTRLTGATNRRSVLLGNRPHIAERPSNAVLAAEQIADEAELTRLELDSWALRSFESARAFPAAGNRELHPTPDRLVDVAAATRAVRLGGDELLEEPTTAESLASCPPTYMRGGKITAGNSAAAADGAAVALLTSAAAAETLGLAPRCTVRSVRCGARPAPSQLLATIDATTAALEAAELSIDAIDAIELDEAFAATALVWQRHFDAKLELINSRGGETACGAVAGARGARLLTTLVERLCHDEASIGLLATGTFDGPALATVLEAVR